MPAARSPRASRLGCVAAIVAALAALLVPAAGSARVIVCAEGAATVNEALARIERSRDPCGESAQVQAVLSALERCPRTTYRICVDTSIRRNTFGRAPTSGGDAAVQTITWNPELRSELEPGCDGDPAKPVQRDPTASLLHEIAHAVQDCQGMNPGAHEVEAIRIENIYRRAAGLCQRSRYGDQVLPADVLRMREAATGACTVPSGVLREAKREEVRPSSADQPDRDERPHG
jgi:hypothetical protein